MKNADNGARLRLESREERLDIFMYVGMGCVLIGVIAEAIPDFLSSNPLFLIITRRIGESLVALGLLGEFIVDILQKKCRATLKEITDRSLNELRLQASEAERVAAEANLARVKIEQSLARREFTTEQSALLSKILSACAGQEFLITRGIDGWEPKLFSLSITNLLATSGWLPSSESPRPRKIYDMPGMYVLTTPDEDSNKAAKLLAKTLNDAGFLSFAVPPIPRHIFIQLDPRQQAFLTFDTWPNGLWDVDGKRVLIVVKDKPKFLE